MDSSHWSLFQMRHHEGGVGDGKIGVEEAIRDSLRCGPYPSGPAQQKNYNEQAAIAHFGDGGLREFPSKKSMPRMKW